MNNIPTIEEFFRQKLKEFHPFKETVTLSMELITAEQGMRWGYEYSLLKSKHHVTEALKQASENVYHNIEIDWVSPHDYSAGHNGIKGDIDLE